MITFKYNLFFFFVFHNFMIHILCQASNEDINKVMSCMFLLQNKYQSSEIQNYSSMLLKCFITISEDEAKEVLLRLEKGMESIESEEIEKLSDISTLNNISKEELKEYSDKLNNAIIGFKKMQEKYYSKKKDKVKRDDTDDENYRRAHPSRGNAFGAFMRKMTGILKFINNMGSVVIVIIFLYFGLIMFRKCRDNSKNKKRSQEKKKNQNKDKNIKKKTE